MPKAKGLSTKDRGPLLGTLLRRAYREVQTHVDEGLEGGIKLPVFGQVGQPLFEHPEGLRATELAARAGITKQSMAELIDAMAASGYVERVPDPADGRARLVRLTARGNQAARAIRRRVGEVEARWVERVGRRRLEALRATLEAIVAAQDDGTGTK